MLDPSSSAPPVRSSPTPSEQQPPPVAALKQAPPIEPVEPVLQKSLEAAAPQPDPVEPPAEPDDWSDDDQDQPTVKKEKNRPSSASTGPIGGPAGEH